MTDDDGLDPHTRILVLAKVALAAEKSAAWKTDIETAAEIHGEACRAMWAEISRQLSEIPAPMSAAWPSAEELNGAAKRRMMKAARKNIAAAVKHAIDQVMNDFANDPTLFGDAP